MHKPATLNAFPIIFLYGPSGSGKSSLGRLLASNLERLFYDLDETITAQVGMPIHEIFASEGESGFRSRERAALLGILDHAPGVVALGGGALLDPENRQYVEASGRVLCLRAPADTLFNRLQETSIQRPLLRGQTDASHDKKQLLDLLAKRAAHYDSFPLQLDTGTSSPERAAWDAQVHLGLFRVTGMGQGYDVRVQPAGIQDLAGMLQEVGLVMESLRTAGLPTQLIRIPAGERYKSMETITRLWEGFLSGGVERGSTVIALGGGVVGDLGGFAAATFLRGVSWVALPTTLLAMVDASLGGKTGANLAQGKNLVGAFHPPNLVLADPATLTTLPEVELRNGLAEVVKHGVIGDVGLFELCGRGWQALQTDWDEVVRRGMAVKIKIIEQDPYEGGRRAALNLGHTIGHAVELASDYQLRHGEAVAIGMVAEARLAERLGLARSGLNETIASTLEELGLPTEIPGDLDRQTIHRAIRVDKKLAKGKVRFALPVHIGEVRTGVVIENLEEQLWTLF
jgi:3-dehydroquinate synthase